jgi:hypothetical protein
MSTPVNIQRIGGRLVYSTNGREGGECVGIQPPGSLDIKALQGAVPVHVHLCNAPVGVRHIVHIAREAQDLVAIEHVYPTAEATAVTCNVRIERLQGTEAPGSGDKLNATGAAASVKSTINTVKRPDVIVAGAINRLTVGDRLCVEFVLDNGTGVAPTELAHFTCVLHVVPVSLPAAASD